MCVKRGCLLLFRRATEFNTRGEMEVVGGEWVWMG
jgi:hypothetical protein